MSYTPGVVTSFCLHTLKSQVSFKVGSFLNLNTSTLFVVSLNLIFLSSKKTLEIETNPEILQRRQKQIDYGKNTVGYQNFIQHIC